MDSIHSWLEIGADPNVGETTTTCVKYRHAQCFQAQTEHLLNAVALDFAVFDAGNMTPDVCEGETGETESPPDGAR